MRSLVISGLMLLALLPPAAAEPFRLSPAEADQVTAGSGFVVPGSTVTINVALGDQTLVDKTLKLPAHGKLVLSPHGKLVLIKDKVKRHIASGIRGKKLILRAGEHTLLLKHGAGKEKLVLVKARGSGGLVFPKHASFVSVKSKNKGSHTVTRSVVVRSSTGGSGQVVQTAKAAAITRSGETASAVAKTSSIIRN